MTYYKTFTAAKKICTPYYICDIYYTICKKRKFFNIRKVLGEFFYVVTRVTVKAQRRKNERKMEKAKLLEKPLLEKPVAGEEKV